MMHLKDSNWLVTLLPPSNTTTGKTSPTSASPTIQGPALPKGPSVSEKGTHPAEGEQGGRGSPGLEPISVEMEGKGAARGFKFVICLLVLEFL